MIDVTLQISVAVGEMPAVFVEAAKVAAHLLALLLRKLVCALFFNSPLCRVHAAPCTFAAAADYCTRPLCSLQKRVNSVVKRLKRHEDIFEAVRLGHVAIVQDYILANPAQISQEEW